jgi:hypothetical protein
MKRFCLRPVAATALSLWLGFLACVLGCANVSTAFASSPETRVCGLRAAPCPDRDGDAGESCCRHGHNPVGGSEKNGHYRISCCPAEAALIQKQNVVPPSLVHLDVAASAIPDFRAADSVSATATARSSLFWPVGRDILLQVHLLRI